MKTAHDELLAKLLRAPCMDWPDCRCADKWQFWDRAADHLHTLSPDEWEGVLLSLACMLSCIAYHCHDRFYRHLAIAELLHPAFDGLRDGPLWRN
jgi:hypothetical protein